MAVGVERNTTTEDLTYAEERHVRQCLWDRVVHAVSGCTWCYRCRHCEGMEWRLMQHISVDETNHAVLLHQTEAAQPPSRARVS